MTEPRFDVTSLGEPPRGIQIIFLLEALGSKTLLARAFVSCSLPKLGDM